ncbi:uncharacterized protein LOC130621465 [Hydractinia symbiolongicarpus]|uniref:uncharacterized protein LOC130621465 n=1 Tax=Hydractinia symbiolongicarpus TaxID=13093 RepID=UPI00254E4C39|nr:uncharacterized protein LOC130621465 [Hydractinia symbiolongicarpus]
MNCKMAAKMNAVLLLLLLYSFSCEGSLHVNVFRRAEGDIFSYPNINCKVYGAKQLYSSRCLCRSDGKESNQKIAGTLYTDEFGYTRCFYDQGASVGCYSPEHFFENNTMTFNSSLNNATARVRLVYDNSKYSSFSVVNAGGKWKSDGDFLQLTLSDGSSVGRVYFLNFILFGKNGVKDKEFCALVKTQNEKPVTVWINSMILERVKTLAKDGIGKLSMYIFIGFGIVFLILVLVLTRSLTLNCHYHRLLWLGKKVLTKEKPLGSASKFYTEAGLLSLYKKQKAAKQAEKDGNKFMSENDESVHIVIENATSEREEPDGSVKTPQMMRMQTLGESTKKSTSPSPSRKNVLLPSSISSPALRRDPLEIPNKQFIIPRSEHKIDGREKDQETNEEENFYEVDIKVEEDYENVDDIGTSERHNTNSHRHQENVSSSLNSDKDYEVVDEDMKGMKEGVVTDYEVVDNSMTEEPYLKMYVEAYLTPIETQYENLGENADNDDDYDYSLTDLSKVKQYR